MQRRDGITRTVFITKRSAIKIPSLRYRKRVRGWLANRSEWKQRRRGGVNRPTLTLGYVVQWYQRALPLENYDDVERELLRRGHEGDEAKASSWGVVNGERVLIDFDRAWEHPRGWVGAIYYGRQERLARKWIREAQ